MEAVRSGRAQLVRDRWAEVDGGDRTPHRSVLAVPLVQDAEVIGIVVALAVAPEVFTENDLFELGMLANVASSTLASALMLAEHEGAAARLAAVAEAVGEGLIEVAADGRVIFGNGSAERILGVSWDCDQADLLARPRYEFFTDDGTPCPPQQLPVARTISTGQPQSNVVLGVKDPTGKVSWLLVSTVPVRRGGEVVSAVASFSDITQARRLEESRRVDTERLRAAQELTGLGWWSLDLETGQHVWSDQMFRLVGLEPSADPPSHEEFLRLLHPDDLPAAQELGRSNFYAGQGNVFRVILPDGQVRHLQSWTALDSDDNGATTTVRGATIDVSGREQAAEELTSSRRMLAAALELTGVATWRWDPIEDRVYWSEAMGRLLGRPAEEVTAVEDFFACLHPDDRERLRELGRREVASGQGEETSYRVVHPDGRIRHVRALTALRTGPDGAVTEMWGTAIDVTEQVEASAQLASSEEHFRVAFDYAPIGMAMLSLESDGPGRYLRVNAALLDMLGYREEEMLGRPFTEITHPDDVEMAQLRFSQLVVGELQTAAFEKRCRRQDGTTLVAWLTSAVVRDREGKALYLVTHALDITERLQEQAELQRLALTDTLTGLYNRTLLIDRLDQALARLQRTDDACAMLLLDVDRFKLVNDSLGHLVGDALLVEIASRIRAVSRADATVARLGGDEFVVLVEDVRGPDDIHNVAKRLLTTLRRPYSLGPTGENLVVTVSMGIAIAATPDRTYVDLYREADLALYRAKDAGRDQYALFDDELRNRAESRMSTEAMLRRALDERRLIAHFQPVISLEDGSIWGAEALARIPRDDGTLVMPGAFVDVAEETGLVVDLDGRMFELAIAEFARTRALGHPLRRIGSNVSARSLEDPTFVERLRQALVWHGVSGEDVRVELTETSLLNPSPTVAQSLSRMLELGMQIGLDDFGTGYSALAYLGQVTLQFLKIDRSFVGRLGRSAEDDAVVAAVIALAKAYRLAVVGEGVETPEQLAALRTMGCDWAQGYLIARPMSGPDLEQLLASGSRW